MLATLTPMTKRAGPKAVYGTTAPDWRSCAMSGPISPNSPAEMRMANEIDRGQESGEVARKGRPSKMSEAPTFSDLGIRGDQVRDWREVRDAAKVAAC